MASVLIHRVRLFFLPERGALHPAPYAVVVAAAMALTTALALTGPLQRVEWAVYDAFIRLGARSNTPAPDVVVVAIDEPSFAEIGLQWPWPRGLHAQLIDAIAAERPASIVFDILFDAPGASAAGDEALADAVRRAGNVVLGSDLAPIEDRNYSVTVWSDPIPPLAQAAAAVAAVSVPLDPDGAMRRAAFSVEGRPTLSTAAVARSGVAAPAGSGVLFRFNGDPRRGIETASYYQALDPKGSLRPGFFTGKHVFIGRALRAPATHEADHFRTPVAVLTPGVTVHATIADAMLRGRFLADPFDTQARVAALCLLIAAIAAAVTYRLQPGHASIAALAASAFVFLVGYAAFAYGDTRLPVVAPLLTLGAAYAAGAGYRFTLSNRERRLIKRAFTHYVAPAIVEQMLRDPSKLKLGGEEHDVTVLFSDLEGFTTLSEHLTPQQLTSHLTSYFRDMLDRLLAERATLDKLIGDAIMVYFGCPVPDAAHPVQACRAALAMQKRMVELNAQWTAHGLPALRTRIGLNSGRVIAGNMGTDTIFNYTVLGDVVNLASRLEGVNKEYGTLTIVSEDTWARVSDGFEGRELDWIRVKGKKQPVSIYELVSAAGELDDRRRELFARFASGLAAYRAAEWREAELYFTSALEIDGADGPSRTFLARCGQHAGAGTPADWDGVHVMQSK